MPVDYTPCCFSGLLWLIAVVVVGQYLHRHAPAYEAEREDRSKPSPRTVFWTIIAAILLAIPAFALAWLFELLQEWVRGG
jgi:hypothetical protein